MKDYAYSFYHSMSWRTTREAYIKSVGRLCELCLKNGIYRPAAIVHHKVWINPKNINNPEITLNWNNLIAVCREHHEKIHDHPRYVFKNEKDLSNMRYAFADDGSIVMDK